MKWLLWILFPTFLFAQQIKTDKQYVGVKGNDAFNIINISAKTIVLDSVSSAKQYIAINFIITENDTSYARHFNSSSKQENQPINITILPGDTAQFVLKDYDPCTICNSPGTVPDDTLYFYVNNQDSSAGEIIITGVTGMDKQKNIPMAFSLKANYPNPFNPITTIPFTLNRAGKVTITLHNILGKKIAVLLDKYLTAGQHKVPFNGARLASGVYVYKLQSGRQVQLRKMLLVK